jgi:hypothetical protein
MRSPYAVWHCAGFGLFSFRFYDARLFIGPINEIECPIRKWRGSFSLVLVGNDLLAEAEDGYVHPMALCTVPQVPTHQMTHR